MDRPSGCGFWRGPAINGRAEHVQHAAQNRLTHGDLDRATTGAYPHPKAQTAHRGHCHSTHHSPADERRDFQRDVACMQQVMDARDTPLKRNINNPAPNGRNGAIGGLWPIGLDRHVRLG